MVMIQLPDEQAAALQAKAAAQGLTLEAWLGNLAGTEARRRTQERHKLADLIARCDLTAPLSDEDKEWLQVPPIGREAL